MSDANEPSLWLPEKAIPAEIQEYIKEKAQTKENSSSAFSNTLVFLHIISLLKTTKRTGWLNFNIDNPESIADHMYRMSIIAFLTTNETLDKNRCIKIALVHDMAESLVGDITPVDTITKEEKHRREYTTMVYLTDKLLKPYNPAAAKEIQDLYEEYENISTPEAQFVKDVDKFELILQTLEYEKKYERTKDLTEFISVRKVIKTPEVQEWADQVLKERDAFWKTTDLA